MGVNFYSNAQTVGGNTSIVNNGTLLSNSSLKFSDATTGILHPRSSTSLANYLGLDFFVNNGASPRMRISSLGNIAIGDHTYSNSLFSLGSSPNNSTNMKFAICDLPYDPTWEVQIRYGLGHFGETVNGNLKRVFAFYVTDPGKSRYGFFDDYAPSVPNSSYPVPNANGYEFVTFNAANRSVGICNTSPTAKLQVNSLNSGTDPYLLNLMTSTGTYMRLGAGNSNSNNLEINAFGNSGTKNFVLQGDNNSGNVGVGVFPSSSSITYSTASSKLHIQTGNLQITNSGPPALITDAAKYGLTLGANVNKTSTALDYSWLQSSSGPIVLNPRSPNTITSTNNSTNYVAIGYVPDGSAVAPGYNLLIKGKVLCEELKIKLKPTSAGTAWPDYVFASDYKLMSLDSLENYISQNSHLPDIPSAAEVEENGIMAGEMNGLLLKKVEELTLYMIEQNKQLELLKIQNTLLQKQINTIKKN